MRKRYGKARGNRIFYARANKLGKRGKSLDSKVRSVYKRKRRKS